MRVRTVLIILICIASAAPPSHGAIVLSELMYNPIGGSEYEFIELHNTGPANVDLNGYAFSDGVSYTFTGTQILEANEFLVLAGNATVFLDRYPAVTTLLPGNFTGNLNNDGERLELVDAASNIVLAVTYNDADPWPEAADGLGSSLVLVDTASDPDNPDSWAASLQLHGSPGEDNVAAVQDIVINEVLTHSDVPLEDAIELYNVSTGTVDIGGWFLSDQDTVRKKYPIPAGTQVPAGGYVVFYEIQFNNPALGTNAFALSSGSGDQVYLSAADAASNIYRFVDQVAFGPAENAVSFGRFPNGTGPLVTMENHTFGISAPASVEHFRTGTGAANSGPRVGPIVINEIMYHPPDYPGPIDNDFDEYVEILNITGGPVSLFDPLNPSNTWQMSDAVQFAFPTGAVLQAGEMALVIGTDQVANFRLTNNVPTNVTIFAPWIGKLDNSADSVRLLKPDPPNSNNVPYILVDQVDYRDDLPWPAGPDGQGSALERISAVSFGNDAQNWQSSLIGGSPGAGNNLQQVTNVIIISEFMAFNETTLADEDGDYRDWIELFNTSTTDVNLVNWFLTDTQTNLTQWMFPGVVISASSHLLVFASGKDRRNPSSELHTNFRLDPGGEYLALLRPNLEPEFEFAPSYPPQIVDVSYGIEDAGDAVVNAIIDGQAGKVLVPVTSNDVDSAWNTLGYDDASWSNAMTGIGYDTAPTYGPLIATDLETQMFDRQASAYLRMPFELDLGGLQTTSMTLGMRYDDGFAAFMNGTEIASANAPPAPRAWNALASAGQNDANAVNFEPFNVDAFLPLLQQGTNVLAIHGLNAASNSSDFLISPELEIVFNVSTALGSHAYFQPATPSAGNGQGFPGVAEKPIFSQPGGVLTNAFDLTLSVTNAGSLIYYTLDGSVPDENATLYGAPIAITNEIEVRARVFLTGFAPGPVVSEVYRNSFLGINEFMPDNVTTVAEMVDFSDFDDWIELYNDSSMPVDISGYHLTDNPNLRFRWAFPAGTVIPGKGHLLVWADGVDQVPGVTLTRSYWPFDLFTTQNYHANFKLATEGEFVGLYNTHGARIDGVEYGLQQSDVSFGRVADGADTWRYFGEATPGMTNAGPTLLVNSVFATEPEFSMEGGFFTGTQVLALTNESPTAVIHYTIDSSPPTSASPIYTNVLSLTSTTVIRARVFDQDVHPGPIGTHSYFIDETTHTLPVVCFTMNPLHLDDSQLGIYENNYKQREIPVSIEYYDSPTNKAFHINAGARLFGINIIRFAQKPFSIALRSRYGTDVLGYQLFEDKPIADFTRFIFRNSGDDLPDSYFRDAFMQDIMRGHIANARQSYQPVVAYLNGAYFGLLNLRDKLDETFFPLHYDVEPEDIDYWENEIVSGGVAPRNAAGTPDSWTNLLSFMNANDLSISSNYEVVENEINIEDLIDMVIVESFIENISWFHNRKWWRDRGPNGKWRWAPFDLDRGFDLANVNVNVLNEMDGTFDSFRELSDNQEFRDYFIQRYAGHINSTFLPERLIALIDDIESQLAPEMPGHIARWGSQDGINNFATWQAEVEEMREFARQRPAQAISQVISHFGLSGAGEFVIEHEGAGSGQVLANHAVLPGSSITNTFFLDAPLELRAVADIGHQFVHWEVEGGDSSNIINPGSTWKYLDTGVDLLSAWTSPTFNDSAWTQGVAQLGYGDGDEATVVSFGPNISNKFVTTYFRKSFVIPNPLLYVSANLRLVRDDGAVVYLNGNEVGRQNMPAGAVNYLTLASPGVGGAEESVFYSMPVDVMDFTAGTNVLAVEIHQAAVTSSDISFDLELTANTLSGIVTTNMGEALTFTPTGSGVVRAVFEPLAISLVPELIGSNTVLNAAGSPFYATGDIIVPSNTTFQLDAGVELFMPDTANILVFGELIMNGAVGSPVQVLPNPNDNARRPLYINTNLCAHSGIEPRWGGIAAHAATAPMSLSNVTIRGASMANDPVKHKAAISGFRSELLMDGLDIEDVHFPIFVQEGASTILRNSRLRTDVVSDLINVKRADFALIENCDMKGNLAIDTDAIDYDGMDGGIIRGNWIYDFRGFNSDGIDIGEGAQNILIESNLIVNCNDKGISIGQGSTAIARRNVIAFCDQGFGIKDSGSHAEIIHNTFYMNGTGVAVFEKNVGIGGGSANLVNCIVADSIVSPVSSDQLSTVTVSYCLSDTVPLFGTGNRIGNPRFVDKSEGDFHLKPGSPAINRGDPGSDPDPDGTRADMGAFSFDSTQGYLVISEIHYHPAQGVSNDFEFIELINPGGATVDASGFTFSDGIVYTFPPGTMVAAGEYILICYNASNYTGLGPQVFEWTTGVLDNNGENLRLIDMTSNEVDRVDYNDVEPWPPQADGLGPSLSLIHPLMDNRLASSWEASDSLAGTPGQGFDGHAISNFSIGGSGEIGIDMFSHPDMLYTLLCKDDLLTQQWTIVEGPVLGDGSFIIMPDSGLTQRFYRIQFEYE